MSANTPEKDLAPVPVDPWILADVAYARYHDPHEVLGAHVGENGVTIRTVRHLADDVVVVTKDGTHPATHEQDGVWVAVLPGQEIPDYRIKVTYGDETTTVDDPYRYMPTLGEMDTYLISEGRHEELWEVLGAHVKRYDGPMGEVEGTAFAVWAPNARAVRVVGDFNYWDGTATAMRSLGSSGVWEPVCATSSSSASPTAPGTRRPTRWPAPPRSPRPPPRWSPTSSTSGRTRSGWPSAPPPTPTAGR